MSYYIGTRPERRRTVLVYSRNQGGQFAITVIVTEFKFDLLPWYTTVRKVRFLRLCCPPAVEPTRAKTHVTPRART